MFKVVVCWYLSFQYTKIRMIDLNINWQPNTINFYAIIISELEPIPANAPCQLLTSPNKYIYTTQQKYQIDKDNAERTQSKRPTIST